MQSKRTTEKGSSNELAQDREYRLQSIEASLKEKESQLVACEQRLEARDNQIQELELEIQSLRKDYRQISDANTLTAKSGVQEMICNVVSHENISAQMLEKDKEIENLNMELRKRTFNLQVCTILSPISTIMYYKRLSLYYKSVMFKKTSIGTCKQRTVGQK